MRRSTPERDRFRRARSAGIMPSMASRSWRSAPGGPGQPTCRRRLTRGPRGRRPAGVLAGLAAALVALPARGTTDVVVAGFDLAAWHAQGGVTLASNQVPPGDLRRLIDGSPSTGVLLRHEGPLTINLAFPSPQLVRQVALHPGDGARYALGLAVVPEGGERTLLAEMEMAGAPAVFSGLQQRVSAVELIVESLEPERGVSLVEVGLTGDLPLRLVMLANIPQTLPEGGVFEPRVLGGDDWGGLTDVTPDAQILMTPARAIEAIDGRRYRARVSGPIALAPRLGGLEGEIRSLLVQPMAPAPPEPLVRPGQRVVQLTLGGDPPLRVLRRASGEQELRPVGIAWGVSFSDEAVEEGAAYSYSVQGVDRFGNVLTELSPEARMRTRTRLPEGGVEIGRLPLLVALYVDTFDREGGSGEAERIVESLEQARAFMYRHSRGRLVLDMNYVAVRGRTPPTTGPSMAGIERDLHDLGVRDDEFGAVFAVSNDLVGSHGNFVLLGRSGGAMGRGPGVPTPGAALGPDPGVAYAFVHELWHVLAGRIAAAAGASGVPSGDLAQDLRFGPLGSFRDRPFDVGEAWDAHAALLAGMDFWSQVPRPFRRLLEIQDTDGDGLADEDPRLPFDELRLGTSPTAADSDGDGLDDMEELAAGLYAGTHPQRADSDGDGVPDGADPWPLSDFRGAIPHGSVPAPLAQGPLVDLPTIRLAACWDADALVLEIVTPFAADAFLDLDGSGHLGRWESDLRIGPVDGGGTDVWCGPARLALRAHVPPLGVFVGERPVVGAAIQATARPDGGFGLTIRLPTALGPGATDATLAPDAPEGAGLRLEPGRVLGLALTVRPTLADDPAPFATFAAGQPWVSLFETHRLLDAVLAAPATPTPATAPGAAPASGDALPLPPIGDAPAEGEGLAGDG